MERSHFAPVVLTLAALLVFGCSMVTPANAANTVKHCAAGGGVETLDQIRDKDTDLVVEGTCYVNGTIDNGRASLLFVFDNVNIINGGRLIFQEGKPIDFWAESILIENHGELTAVSANAIPGYSSRLTIHLWGAPNDDGITCQSKEDTAMNVGPCGIPLDVWTANPIMAHNLAMDMPPPPSFPKNAACKSLPGHSTELPGDDCFYQYEVQDAKDRRDNRKAYFGHKVLALSFGGTLQLEGAKGSTFGKPLNCVPSDPTNECSPAFTGESWARLTTTLLGESSEKKFTLDRTVHWKAGDQVVITPTDYLPSHSEVATLEADPTITNGVSTITVKSEIKYPHWGSTTAFPSTMPADVGPQNDPNVPKVKRAVDTRAAVGLLTRDIQIVSAGNLPDPDSENDPFPPTPGNFYGGHTIVRQGFTGYQVQGVEFYRLGQGGQKGRYPVHFHMARKTRQPALLDKTPLNYLKDCSIWDSMTRWVTVHATEGMYIARNVGYKSIGHGFYLEDATEVNNKFYANLGIEAQAAIQDATHNPRQVPGILADNSPSSPPARNGDYMPYRSDYNHPTIFWITNGWNDFEYNMAAGAATCGACYWWLPAANSGPSQYQTWDGYASQQIVVDRPTNYNRAGLAPLKTFVGNSCVAAMTSFQVNGQTADCLGVKPDGSANLSAVESTAPPGPDARRLPEQPFQIYYPVLSEVHNPTLCTTSDCTPSKNLSCDQGYDSHGNCAITHLDHYTTSFNFAQTNFSAVWLRKGWDLVTNSAITDALQGGLNFVTGGGYTRSDVGQGEWQLARNNVFIGHTQESVTDDPNANSFASDVGPFNSDSKLECDNAKAGSHDHCEYSAGGMSYNLPDFPAQKLFNIYDGPAHQVRNAYLDITIAKIADCSSKPGGSCKTSAVPLAWNFGVLQATDKSCYLPNAAIGWKQPNGFYYPPAFHSNKLWFQNVDIRHFVIEPLFDPITPAEYDPFVQNQTKVNGRYCTHSSDMFSKNFNNIDRQTVLNDDDGTLTGLLGSEGGVKRPSISINEDDYFNAPLTTPECLSDIHVQPPLPLPAGLPFTATTSPYEWLTTAVIADCAIASRTGSQQCFDTSIDMNLNWAHDCGSGRCRGVPLYREFLTDDENTKKTRPQIRMMGQGNGQRSTLSLNHGAYLIDTSQTCASQGNCPVCIELDPENPKRCRTYDFHGDPRFPSIFLKGHTYYVYFVYATAETKQHYDIYIGPGYSQTELNVTAVRLNPNDYSTPAATNGSFISPTYPAGPNGAFLSVDLDLSGQKSDFDMSKPKFCNPKAYCSAKSDGSCGCNPKNSECTSGKVTDADCAWASADIDCPVDPNSPTSMKCFGFSFKMPDDWKAPSTPIIPDVDLFKLYTSDSNFAAGKVTFVNGKSISPNDACVYSPVPTQP